MNTKLHGDFTKVIDLPNWDAAAERFPFLASDRRHAENKTGFKAIYNSNAGWVEPVQTMELLHRECVKLGVVFVHGDAGTAVSMETDPSGEVIGVKTADETTWHADKIVLAVGAYSDTLLDFKSQLQAVSRYALFYTIMLMTVSCTLRQHMSSAMFD